MLFARILVVLFATISLAQVVVVSAAETDFFEARIRPVLVEHCYGCHNSADTAEGDLAVDYRDGLRGVDRDGVALVVPGDPAASRLIAILKHEIDGLEMPEDGAKLNDRILADFERWIAAGAIDPRDDPPTAESIQQLTSWAAKLERRKQWWSFQSIKRQTPPRGDGHPIDRFIQAKLDEVGMSPAPPAAPEVLIRRLYFQIIGMPPSPDELDHWLRRYDDAGNTNVESKVSADIATRRVTDELVDQLLANDQFGPRWARHWMDWIRYAESHGSEGDPLIPNAWMYRDYLIRALNDDVPYDQLVREHLAGDLLPKPRINRELGLNESVLGAIQLRMVFHGFSPTDALDEKVRFIDDQINTVSKAFLGLTVSCARCHDHKFDAISQADYYAMFGIFAACRPGRTSAETAERLNINRDLLQQLKPKIRTAISESWIETLPNLEQRISEAMNSGDAKNPILTTIQKWNQWGETKANHESEPVQRWDLSQANDLDRWFHDGVEPESQRAGQFAIAVSGDQALSGIYPAGVYSHLISNKHPLRITSPDVQLDDKYDVWVRAIGGGDARLRYVVQDYPRTGTVYPATNLGGQWTWHKLALEYWQGDSIHLELATGADIPLLASSKTRSWFGVSDVRVVPKGSLRPADRLVLPALMDATDNPPPASQEEAIKVVSRAIKQAIHAWQANECTDAQAELIDRSMRAGLVENNLDVMPAVRPLVEDYRRLESQLPQPRRVPSLDEIPEREQALFVRGNHKQPGAVVPRRFLEAIDTTAYPVAQTGRRQLAEDILREDNPLSRRVIVNRVWHHMFGRGIVATPDNFGQLGEVPTHPKLLDYLATQFVDQGWSIKRLIRLIATSQTWQRSSKASSESARIDPDNHYLSHANLRRLEAEAIRDAVLLATGKINLSTTGPPVDGRSNRRSVFLSVKRNSLNSMLRVFDFPEPVSAVGRRNVTNVPAQSLAMMNSPWIAARSAEIADRIVRDEAKLSKTARLQRLSKYLFSRQFADGEVTLMRAYLSKSAAAWQQQISERAEMASEIDRCRTELAAIIEPQRQELASRLKTEQPAASVEPFAVWDFDDDLSDQNGRLHGQSIGQATVDSGQLTVSNRGHVNTTPLNISLTEKTLEVWVRLDTLDQRGGGVMTIQTPDGIVFDSIVFAEKQPFQWLAGSNGFTRTQVFRDAPAETEADKRFIHFAISYHADGTIAGYRDGQPYGKTYRATSPIAFEKDQAIVSFGVRHLPGVGNRRLAGQIDRAHLYDRALSADEIKASFQYWTNGVTDRQVLAALSEATRSQVAHMRKKIEKLQDSLDSRGDIPPAYDPALAWTDLTRALLTAKEFLYVR